MHRDILHLRSSVVRAPSRPLNGITLSGHRMRTKASRLEILRQSEGVPPAAASPDATVLECDLLQSTKAGWRWADEHAHLRRPRWTKEDRARVAWMRLYCGKPLIFACLEKDRSVFTVLVDPRARKAVFWDESRRLPSGRITRRCSGPPRPERRTRSYRRGRRLGH